MIIAKSCGCGGDSLSPQEYYDMRKEYGNNVYNSRLDSKIDKGLDRLKLTLGKKLIMIPRVNTEINTVKEFIM